MMSQTLSALRSQERKSLMLDKYIESLFYCAKLPAEIVTKYARQVYLQFHLTTNRPSDYPGVKYMAEALGVETELNGRVLRCKTKTKLNSVKLDYCDKLCRYGDFSLDEIYDEAIVWAEENDHNWPIGYEHKALPEGVDRKEYVKRVKQARTIRAQERGCEAAA